METSYRVIVQDIAQADLHDIWAYIAGTLHEPAIAARMLNKLEHAILSLSEFPQRYALLSDELLQTNGIRKIPVDNYIIFYRVNEAEESVAVLRVLHGRRNWESLI